MLFSMPKLPFKTKLLEGGDYDVLLLSLQYLTQGRVCFRLPEVTGGMSGFSMECLPNESLGAL